MGLHDHSPVRNVLSFIGRLSSLLLFLSAYAGAAEAQQTRNFISLSYHARETLEGRDNDILRLRFDIENPRFASLSRLTIFGGFQDVGVNLGASSRDSSFDQLELGAEALWAISSETQRRGFGLRLAWAEPYAVSYEAAGVFERFGDVFDYRFFGGLQGVTSDVPRRDDVSLFGVAEGTWWITDGFLFRVGVQGDSDGALATTGFEVGLWGSAASFYMDFGIAIDGYRGIQEYNDLIGGFRFALGGDRSSLKERVRSTTLRSLYRTIQVQ